jgi:protein-tyrosine phosphatase
MMTETITPITEQIYLGNFNGYRPEILIKHKIDVVISVLSEPERIDTIKKMSKVKGVLYYVIDIRDIPDQYDQLYSSLREIYPKIEHYLKKGKKIFFHCLMGISRSASSVIYTLMRYHNLTYKVGFSYVKQKRDVIRPNYMFAKMLEKVDFFLRNQ